MGHRITDHKHLTIQNVTITNVLHKNTHQTTPEHHLLWMCPRLGEIGEIKHENIIKHQNDLWLIINKLSIYGWLLLLLIYSMLGLKWEIRERERFTERIKEKRKKAVGNRKRDSDGKRDTLSLFVLLLVFTGNAKVLHSEPGCDPKISSVWGLLHNYTPTHLHNSTPQPQYPLETLG